MEQYIKKSDLVAEMNSLLDRCNCYGEYERGFRDGNNGVIYKLKEKINSLEVKEVDLEKECSKYFEDNDLCVHDDCIKFAKHFFELGLNSRNES